MAGIQPQSQDQLSPGLTLSLSSNNPFRNRAGSPLPTSPPASPFDDPNPRPVSNNPFLEPSRKHSSQQLKPSTDNMAAKPNNMVDLLGDLSIEEKKSNPPPRPPPMNRPSGAPRGENMPPPGRRGPPPGHRPSRSQEEALRARRQRPNGPNDPSSPPRRAPSTSNRPARRNSESSITEEKPLTAEERKARELRRQERERRHRERREDKTKVKPANKKMDIIDRLDATSIYGTGMFHHDGPFDAANPHRNKNGSRRAPMQAFAKDSLNMSIGGSGPLNTRLDHATFMGTGNEEAFTDYALGADKPVPISKSGMPVFDPLSRGTIVHGDQSVGLGTSTFLEGTPAARSAVQRLEQESSQDGGGLQRKKSLAQRIRGINREPRGKFGSSGRVTSPDGVYRDHVSSASMSSARSETNPFFNEYDSKKGGEEQISVRKMSAQPSPPLPGQLERRATSDALGELEQVPKAKSSGGGLLSRVKSLKGGPRSRPADRSDREYPPAPTAA